VEVLATLRLFVEQRSYSAPGSLPFRRLLVAHGLVIRGGTVVDGSGSPPRAADVAVDDGRISAVGLVDEPGSEEIDARGAIVTPGFIDLHTHYDAQVGWDRLLTPSSWHGVTTTLLGNCGMTFAPVRPGDARRLAEMMETVEEIPADAILSGLPWTWESYGQYLDFVEERRVALNVAGMVGHCALRYYVMGDRAVDEQPDEDEIARLAGLAAEALDQGAAGFSTSRFPGHLLPDRRAVPGTFASRGELLAIAEAIRGRGLFQAVLNTGDLDHDMELLVDIGAATGGRVLVASAAVDPAGPDGTAPRFKQPTPVMLERAQERGADITATLMPREGGAICGLFAKLPWRTPAWNHLDQLPHPDRLAAIRVGATRTALVEEAEHGRAVAPPAQIFSMGDEIAHYMVGPEHSLAALAAAGGQTPAETFLDLAQATHGRAMFMAVQFNRDPAVLREMLASNRFLPGLGDAGAHLTHVVDASYTTFFLSHWVRDTATVELAEGVRRLTSAPAALLGASDRGRLRVDSPADLNVIDLEELAALAVEPMYDAPFGAARLVQRAKGYRATLVNGTPIVLDDEHTGLHPGRVLR
jgi:N-acyl-D-amino-acid deacylase